MDSTELKTSHTLQKKYVRLLHIASGGGGESGEEEVEESVMWAVAGRCCSKKQMLRASSYTASLADRDIIYIQRDLPFMLIGHQQEEEEEGEERQRRGLRWSDRRPKEQLLHVSARG